MLSALLCWVEFLPFNMPNPSSPLLCHAPGPAAASLVLWPPLNLTSREQEWVKKAGEWPASTQLMGVSVQSTLCSGVLYKACLQMALHTVCLTPYSSDMLHNCPRWLQCSLLTPFVNRPSTWYNLSCVFSWNPEWISQKSCLGLCGN